MPLSLKGKTILANMRKQYGVKAGKENFYAKMVKDPKGTKSWHRGIGSGKIRKSQRTYKKTHKRS